ncbi:hypothetical protein ES702_04892 [subsurface metagenome]
MNSKRKKLLNIFKYITGQKELIKCFEKLGYHQPEKIFKSWEKNINALTDKDIDSLTKFLKKIITAFEKKDNQKLASIIEEGLIKVSIPSLEQKFAVTKYNQLSIFDVIEDKKLVKEAEDLNIKIIGWDLSKAEDQAVFAIQKIYSKYGYRGNYENGNALVFTPVEFYQAFGLLKYKYRSKEIYSHGEKNQAFKSLINLSKIQCIMVYNIRNPETKKFNKIEALSSIIPEIDFLYTDLDKKELDNGKKKKEKLRYIKIIPSKVLLSQIEKNYYALLPSNFYKEIREKFPKVKNKHLPLFIQWIAKTIALKKRKKEDNITEISFEKLAKLLRMNNWLKARQSKRVNDRLIECLKLTKKLEYLNWYKISSGKTVIKKVTLSINIDKFRTSKRIKEIIDSSYEKKGHIEEVKEIKDSEEVKKQKEKIRTFLGIVR